MKNIYTTQYKITDNRGYEEYLSNGVIVEVIERIRVEQDELLKTRIIMKDGNPLWIRGDMCTKVFVTDAVNSTVIERVICIPDSGGHTLDLQRVQYISPLEKGSYKVTLVSGWDLPLTDKVYSRQTLIEKWKALQNVVLKNKG